MSRTETTLLALLLLLPGSVKAQVTVYDAAGRKLGLAAGSLRLIPTSTPTRIATAAPTARPSAPVTPAPTIVPSAVATPVSGLPTPVCLPIPAPIPGSGLTFASPVNMQTVSGTITVSYNIADAAIIATELGVDGQLSGLRDGYASVTWDTTGKTYGLPLANGCHQLQVIGLDWLHRVIGNQFIDVVVAN